MNVDIVFVQIIAKGDKSLGYGIVEFKSSEEAEATWLTLRNEKVEGETVTVTFCIPGKSAVVINNRIMWKYVSSTILHVLILSLHVICNIFQAHCHFE